MGTRGHLAVVVVGVRAALAAGQVDEGDLAHGRAPRLSHQAASRLQRKLCAGQKRTIKASGSQSLFECMVKGHCNANWSGRAIFGAHLHDGVRAR